MIRLLTTPFLFVQHGHLETSDPASTWTRCELAASRLTELLRRYREAYTTLKSPYLIVSTPWQQPIMQSLLPP